LRIIGRVALIFGFIGSLFRKLVKKLWLLMPTKIRNFPQRRRKAGKLQEYYYLKYAISVLRVIAWIVLTLGFIASLVWGVTMGGIEGGVRTILGIIGSFLAWLALLAARELLKLFMDVKENTGNTAERATTTKKPG
jgi:hypothetical protein